MFKTTAFEHNKTSFKEATKAELEIAFSGIEKFGISATRVRSVKTVGALEVNSRNMRIEIDGKSYFLKVTKGKTLEKKIQVLYTGGLLGKTVPRYMKSRTDTFGVEMKDGRYAYLSSDVGQKVIRGRSEEIKSVSRKLCELDELSNKEWAKSIGVWEVGSSWNDMRPYIDNLINCGAGEVEKIDESLGIELEQYRETIDRAFTNSDGLCRLIKDYGVCHFDLHPLNIAVDAEGNCCLLDIDSVLIGPREVAWSYFLFRMARKRICMVDGSQAEIRRIACELTIKGRPSLKDVIPLARREILRRLSKVLRLNLVRGDTRWNKVGGLLLRNIEECNTIEKALEGEG